MAEKRKGTDRMAAARKARDRKLRQQKKASPTEGIQYANDAPPTREQVEALLLAAQRNPKDGRRRRGLSALRNRALITCLWHTGMRVNEALQIRPEDMTYNQDGKPTIVVQASYTKTGESRELPLSSTLAGVLDHWLDARIHKKIARAAPIFCTLAGKRMSAVQVRQLLKHLKGQAGISHRMNPHSLRKRFGHDLVENGVSLKVVQDLLGHKNLETTAIYLRHACKSQRHDAVTDTFDRPAP